MSFIKRHLFFLLSVLLIGIGIEFFFFHKKKVEEKAISLFMPHGTSMYITLPNIKTWRKKESSLSYILPEAMTSWSPLTSSKSKITSVVKLLRDTLLNSMINKEDVNAGLYMQGKKNIIPLYIISLDSSKQKNIINGIHKYIKSHSLLDYWQIYNEYKLHKIHPPDNPYNPLFYFVSLPNHLLLSISPIPIENAIRQYHLPFISPYKLVNVPFDDNEGTTTTLYLDHHELKYILPLLIDQKEYSAINRISDWASNTLLQLHVENKGLFCTGKSVVHPDDYLTIFSEQDAKSSYASYILPSTTESYLSFMINDSRSFWKQHDGYLKKKKKYYRWKTIIYRFTEDKGSSLIDWFHKLYPLEVTFASLKNNKDVKPKLMVIHTAKPRMAEKAMHKLCTSYNLRKGDSLMSGIYRHLLDHEQKEEQKEIRQKKQELIFYRMPDNRFAYRLFGYSFYNWRSVYGTLYNNYLLYAEDTTLLLNVIRKHKQRNTLFLNTDYQQALRKMSTKGHIHFFMDISKGIPFIKRRSRKKWSLRSKENKPLSAMILGHTTTEQDTTISHKCMIYITNNE